MNTARMNYNRAGAVPHYIPEDDPYPLLRSALAPEFAALPVEDVDAVLANNGIRAEDMESFFGDIGKTVGPIATKALPGIISGAAAGCTLGPWGCLGGALIGGVGSVLANSGGSPGGQPAGPGGQPAGPGAQPAGPGARPGGGSSPRPRGAPSAAPRAPAPRAPAPVGSGAVPVNAGATGGGTAGGGTPPTPASALPVLAGLVDGGGDPGGSPATGADGKNPAGVLMGLLQQPQFLQALMAMSLGSAGRKDVQVDDASVPASAFANLISVLGSKAFAHAEAFAEPSEELPEYLYTGGSLMVDPGAPSQRAARLLEMLGESAMRAPRPRVSMYSEADEYYDALDMAELDFIDVEGEDLEFDD